MKEVLINDKPEVIGWHKTFFLERYLQKVNPLDFKIVFDIGACDCQESLTFMKLFPNADITAFECSPQLLSTCRDNIKGFEHRITLVEKMITDIPENNKFYMCQGGQSSLCRPNFWNIPINVPSMRLDQYLGEDNIDLVWIDVQGAELNVLRSFGKKLKNVKTIYCEVDIENERYETESNLKTVTEYLSDFTISDSMRLNKNEMHVIFEVNA